ncbi:MAG TPA: helix-turn-helix domain-containing protein [Bacteroidales bacterium]|nr:helix-turn-helix domain-containing protein [Bacteroidales bacterium]
MLQQPELGRKIADLRKAKGLTQEELVEKCNLSVRTLQRIESGEVTPRSYTIRLIFEALEMSYDSTFVNEKGSFIRLNRQFYLYFIDLFNLKTHTMRKISILTVFIFLTFLGISALTSALKAEKTESQQTPAADTAKSYSTNLEMAWSNFSCDECFEENGVLTGRNVKFEYNGTKVNVSLITVNKMTREFNAGLVKGIFREQRVELSIEKYLLKDKVIQYYADKISKSDNTIDLKGHARLDIKNGEKTGGIETDELIITIR